MSCLGVHFALSSDEVQHLRSIPNDQDRLDHLKEVIEELYFEKYPDFTAESDKAWDAMHRALGSGRLGWFGGVYPLNHAVLCGESLYLPSDYIMSLKTPDQVRDIANALPAVSRDEFLRRYNAIDPVDYGCALTDEDFDYTWQWFNDVRNFYMRAAAAGRFVLFTADQ